MKRKAILAIAMAVCMSGSMAGCGNSSPKNEKELGSKLDSMSEEDFEKAAESIDASDSANAGAEAVTEDSVEEIVYEPTDEILNADFSSGLVQIGNDVFRNGGYYTVNQFIEEFGDRYDMSVINTNGLVDVRKWGNEELFSLSNPDLSIRIHYYNYDKEKKIKLGEAVVTSITPSKSNAQNVWYPKGITGDAEGYDYDNIPSFLEENGYKLTTGVSSDMAGVPEFYGAYWEYSVDKTIQAFKFNDVSSEANLLGFYPMYKYSFVYKLEDAKAYSFDMDSFATYVSDLNEYPRMTE